MPCFTFRPTILPILTVCYNGSVSRKLKLFFSASREKKHTHIHKSVKFASIYSSVLTVKILKKRYLAKVKSDTLSEEAAIYLKKVVEKEITKMLVILLYLFIHLFRRFSM